MVVRSLQPPSQPSSRRQHHPKTSITILVLGDEGVGKSSLISTYVSHHFSEVVPGILTRVRLPPRPNVEKRYRKCAITIVDSQGADEVLLRTAASTTGASTASTASTATTVTDEEIPSETNRLSSSSLFELQSNVDAIVLVYDVDRIETFYRLESHWLPLLERVYRPDPPPVIIAENKSDLFRPASTTEETASLERMRQLRISLMQRFRFCRKCLKCSAKHVRGVDEVFESAYKSVMYPLTPLFDVQTAQFTPQVIKAFARIFRMYDQDHDGLLSDDEIANFQLDTFHSHLFYKELAGWKKVVKARYSSNQQQQEQQQQHPQQQQGRPNPLIGNMPVLQDNKWTLAGFLAIFDTFQELHRLEVPWQVLRRFGYDDDVELQIPESILPTMSSGGTGGTGTSSHAVNTTLSSHFGRDDAAITSSLSSSWRLSESARYFLKALFHQYQHQGVLSSPDVLEIFSIIPEPSLPPWHALRASQVFVGCFSLPHSQTMYAVPPNGSDESSESRSTTTITPEGSSWPSAAPIATVASDAALSASGITICSAESLPTVGEVGWTPSDVTTSVPPLSFLDWMGCWHTFAAISPTMTRVELFRLGHIMEAKDKYGRRKQSSPLPFRRDPSLQQPVQMDWPSHELRILVVGSQGSGKTTLLHALQQGSLPSDSMVPSTLHPETCGTHLCLRRKRVKATKKLDDKLDEMEDYVVHYVFTEVPESTPRDVLMDVLGTTASLNHGHASGNNSSSTTSSSTTTAKKRGYDLVMLVFDSTSMSSFQYVKDWESALLTDEIPRVFCGTKQDCLSSSVDEPSEEENLVQPASSEVVKAAMDHCSKLDLEPPLVVLDEGIISSSDKLLVERERALQHIAQCALEDAAADKKLRSKPHEEQKRKEAVRRRKMFWFGGLVTVGVAVLVGVGIWWSGRSKPTQRQQQQRW